MRRRFAFLHVPKTAGSSASAAIRGAIAAAEPPLDVCPFGLDTALFGAFDRVELIPPERGVFTGVPDELSDFDVILGHFALPSLVSERSPQDVAALFREPRARLLSLYTFWRSWPEERHAEWEPYDGSRRATELNWVDFLADERIAAQTDNAAARLLLGAHPGVPPDRFITDVEAVTADALAVLDTIGHADVIERGAACWDDLAVWLDAPLDVGRRNPTSDTSSFDPREYTAPGARELLADRTSIDAALWRAAAARWGVSSAQAAALADDTAARRSGGRSLAAGSASPTVGVRERAVGAWRRVFRRRAAD